MDGCTLKCSTRSSNAPVAQLDRVLPSEGKGHRFESCRAHHHSAILPQISERLRGLRPSGAPLVRYSGALRQSAYAGFARRAHHLFVILVLYGKAPTRATPVGRTTCSLFWCFTAKRLRGLRPSGAPVFARNRCDQQSAYAGYARRAHQRLRETVAISNAPTRATPVGRTIHHASTSHRGPCLRLLPCRLQVMHRSRPAS